MYETISGLKIGGSHMRLLAVFSAQLQFSVLQLMTVQVL